jgi:ribonuclease Z
VGTGAGAPTLKRGGPSILIHRNGERFMFDCGEATQLAVKRYRFRLKGLRAVFITHMHGDHVLGLPGLVMSLSLNSAVQELKVYGPRGLNEFMKSIFKSTNYWPNFSLEINEIDFLAAPAEIFSTDEYLVRAVSSDHVVPSFAYSFEEKPRQGRFNSEKANEIGIPRGPLWGALQRGESITFHGESVTPNQVLGPPRRGAKIVYSGDTRPCGRILELATNADLFIHEATMNDDDVEGAWAGGHSTVSQALRMIAQSHCARAVLTNFGQSVDVARLKTEFSASSEMSFAEDGVSVEVEPETEV